MEERAMAQKSLEDRIRAVEDRLEIYNLIASHPPSADTGADDHTRRIYTEDATFDRGGNLTGASGVDALAAMVKTPGHQAAIAGGIGHFSSLPHIVLDGDKAVATSYLQILMPQPSGEEVELPNHGRSKGFRVHRLVANRWELVRTAGGWKIKSRKLRLLDGTEPAREILREALAAHAKVAAA
jgi:hypothetical protein